jgi:hypothetical protein
VSGCLATLAARTVVLADHSTLGDLTDTHLPALARPAAEIAGNSGVPKLRVTVEDRHRCLTEWKGRLVWLRSRAMAQWCCRLCGFGRCHRGPVNQEKRPALRNELLRLERVQCHVPEDSTLNGLRQPAADVEASVVVSMRRRR